MFDKLHFGVLNRLTYVMKSVKRNIHQKEHTSIQSNEYSSLDSLQEDKYGFFLMDFKNGSYPFALTILWFIFLNTLVSYVTLKAAESTLYVYVTSFYIICFPFMHVGLWNAGKKQNKISCKIMSVFFLVMSLFIAYFVFSNFYIYLIESIHSINLNIHNY